MIEIKTSYQQLEARLAEIEQLLETLHAGQVDAIVSKDRIHLLRLKETEDAYQANLRQAKVAQKEFEDKITRLERQLSQVKVKEAQAEAAAGLGNVAFSVGDLGDTMKGVEEILNKRYEQSAGKARLAKDMVNMDQVQEKESERKAMEQAALADFLASQGVAAPAQTESAVPQTPVVKEMGPQSGGPA